MKISILPTLSNIHINQTKRNKPTVYNQNITRLPNDYYTPIYFGCNKCEGQTFQNQLENLSRVHCPSCGVVMLNKSEYESMLERAKNIKTTEEFTNFLNENSEHVLPAYTHLLKTFNRLVEQDSNIDFNDLLAIAKSIANKKILNHIDNNIEFLDKLVQQNELSQDDKQLIVLCKTQLDDFKSDKKNISYNNYKEILKNTILKTEYENKFEFYLKSKEKFMQKISERFILNYANNFETTEEKAYNLVKSIFFNSISVYSEIDKKHKGLDLHYNRILLCQSCEKNNATVNNLLHADDAKKENYNKYIDDIAEKAVNDEIDDISYPITLNGFMSKISRRNLDRDSSLALRKLRTKIFYKSNPQSFDLTKLEGIPCACCGKPTITHNKKLEIFEQIEQIKTKEEYLKIIQENKEFIRKKYLPIIGNLECLLTENLSDGEIVDKLRKFGADRINKRLQQNVNYMNDIVNSDKHSPKNNSYIKQYIKAVNKDFLNQPYDKQFPLTEYNQLINDTIRCMDGKAKHKYIDQVRFSIKSLYSANRILYPPPNLYNKFDSPLKIILQEIFKSSVATKDHFVAKHNAGSNDDANLIVLCKGCNTYKSDAKTDSWLRRNPEFKDNIQKQADFIQDKINKGELDSSYLEYLSNIQENLYFLSQGGVEINLNSKNFDDVEDFMI